MLYKINKKLYLYKYKFNLVRGGRKGKFRNINIVLKNGTL